ncbi:peptidoglycan-binding protein, partial [Oceanobacillus kapialis]
IEPNGIADAYTRQKLDELLEAGYQEGDRHEAISDMKEKLNALGFGNILVTDYFGSFTTKKVTDFQNYYGLEVTGTANQETLNKLDALMDTPFQYGGRDDAIIPMKEKLNALGFGHITVTNYYGAFTRSQVKEFQSYYGLVENGIADEPTRNKLDEVMASSFQEGDRHEDISALKEKLNKMGFGQILVTDYYGSFTVRKVKEFQEFYGLQQTGVADAITIKSLDELYNNGFKQGDSHPIMNEFKQKLNKLGFGYITVTDYFGSYSAKKVKEFQSFYGLDATGRINAETIDKLNKAANSFYSYGDRDAEIKEIKKKLNAIGFGNITVTSYFGSFTKKKVSDFQRYYDLPVSGKADPVTMKYLEEVYQTPFQYGQRHADTPGLKEKLNRLGFGYITVTTYFGNYTKQKVEDFQEHYGLISNGIIDKPTLNMLNKINNTSYQKGKRSSGIINLKENLNAIGYGGITLTDYYGSFTEKRVKEFQRDAGLPVSGIADEITRKEIESRIVKVFLDPGHGDHDPGGRGYGLKEKDVVLDIAHSAFNYLSTGYYGVTVQMSRTVDEFIELEERAAMANSWGADYFVSLHTNALNGSANGFETFIHDGNVSEETEERQRDLHTYLRDQLGIKDRGMKEANFSVLRNSKMPAILLEYMFIDNTVENALLKNSSYRNWLGKITADAIAKSFGLKRR